MATQKSATTRRSSSSGASTSTKKSTKSTPANSNSRASAQQDEEALQEQLEELREAPQTAIECFRTYARQRPETVALWALGIGFVLGWKLKPW